MTWSVGRYLIFDGKSKLPDLHSIGLSMLLNASYSAIMLFAVERSRMVLGVPKCLWCLGALVGVDLIILSEQGRMEIRDVNSESIVPIPASTSPRRWDYAYSREHVSDNPRNPILLPVVSWSFQVRNP